MYCRLSGKKSGQKIGVAHAHAHAHFFRDWARSDLRSQKKERLFERLFFPRSKHNPEEALHLMTQDFAKLTHIKVFTFALEEITYVESWLVLYMM